MTDTQTYSCPVCGDDVETSDYSHTVICESCATPLHVERDAQFDESGWHDLTELIPE